MENQNIPAGTKQEKAEFEKAKIFRVKEEIDYVPGSVISKNILNKPTGSIRLMSFDAGEGLAEKISPFDAYIQILEGKAEVVINGTLRILEAGDSLIMPAHMANSVRAALGRFKMVITVIKSGYERL